MLLLRPSRHVVYVLALAVTLLFTHLTFQAQPNSDATPSAAGSGAKPPQSRVKCAENGTYVNSKSQTIKRLENCSSHKAQPHSDGAYSFSQSKQTS
jgi:hypothetical protein